MGELAAVGTKTGRSLVGGPELWILESMGSKERRDSVYPGWGPLEEVNPYVLLGCNDVLV
jgi:hypothetical protein